MPTNAAPLKASFMLTAILGFLISVVYVRKLSLSWAFAFGIVFLIMIIASLISMIEAPARGQLMPQLEREFNEPKPVLEEIKLAKPKHVKRKVHKIHKKKKGKK